MGPGGPVGGALMMAGPLVFLLGEGPAFPFPVPRGSPNRNEAQPCHPGIPETRNDGSFRFKPGTEETASRYAARVTFTVWWGGGSDTPTRGRLEAMTRHPPPGPGLPSHTL